MNTDQNINNMSLNSTSGESKKINLLKPEDVQLNSEVPAAESIPGDAIPNTSIAGVANSNDAIPNVAMANGPVPNEYIPQYVNQGMPNGYVQPNYGYATNVNGGMPNLIIHYSSTVANVPMVSRIVANGRKDVYYTGQVIEFTVMPGFHQLILKIGSKNQSCEVVVPGDGSAVHVYGAFDGNPVISVGAPYIVQCMQPLPPNIQNHVITHTMRADAIMLTQRAIQASQIYHVQVNGMMVNQYFVPPQARAASVPQNNVNMGYSENKSASAPTQSYSVERVVDADAVKFSPIPIIAFVLSISFFLSFIGLIMGVVSLCMKNIRLKGLGIAAVIVGALYSIAGLIYWIIFMAEIVRYY